MPDPMSGTSNELSALFQSTKPLDSIFVIGILEHHIILKDGTVTIAKFIPCLHHQHRLSHRLSHTHQMKYYNND